jgi:long-chain acyl-CoA synthetase
LYSKINDGVNATGGMKKWLFDKAVATKTENYLTNGDLSHGLYDKLVFSKIRAVLGGRVRVMLTASAPISGDVLTFFKIAMGIHVYECFG